MSESVAYHPDGKHIITFFDMPHEYVDNSWKKYLSSTSMIKRFFHEFDSVSQALKCSSGLNPKYSWIDPDEILSAWEAERVRGSTEGSNVHLYAESLVSDWPIEKRPIPISNRCKLLFGQVDSAVQFLLASGLVFISAEMIVFNPDRGISGMIDCVAYDPINNTILIIDWKQNKKISKKNRWQSGFGPLSHLEQTDINVYTLQLSVYQFILQAGVYFENVEYRRILIHIQEKDYKIYELENYKYEVEEMLKIINI